MTPQRFVVYEYDLRGPLPRIGAEPNVEVRLATSDDLKRLRQANPSLPVEFFYDEIYGLSTCFLTFVQGKLAKIDWESLPSEFNRHFHLGPGEAEVFQIYILPEFRRVYLGRAFGRISTHHRLSWLKNHSYEREYDRVARSNRVLCAVLARYGYRRVGAITHLAFYCPKFKRRNDTRSQ